MHLNYPSWPPFVNASSLNYPSRKFILLDQSEHHNILFLENEQRSGRLNLFPERRPLSLVLQVRGKDSLQPRSFWVIEMSVFKDPCRDQLPTSSNSLVRPRHWGPTLDTATTKGAKHPLPQYHCIAFTTRVPVVLYIWITDCAHNSFPWLQLCQLRWSPAQPPTALCYSSVCKLLLSSSWFHTAF